MQLKILTWNIQAGIGTQAAHQYASQAYRQVLHTPAKKRTLKQIAKVLKDYDLVALQEVDLGGRRSNFQNQADLLQSYAKFPHAISQENRVVGRVSRHGNAIFSKYPILETQDLKLPGSRTGRGVLIAKIDLPKPIYFANTHLSLGLADQNLQSHFISENVPEDGALIVAGDMNCGSNSTPMKSLSENRKLNVLTEPHDKSYPSWKPRKDYDHILADARLGPAKADVVESLLSDHRPVQTTLTLKG